MAVFRSETSAKIRLTKYFAAGKVQKWYNRSKIPKKADLRLTKSVYME